MLTSWEKRLASLIRAETDQLNVDNISRTKAYLYHYLGSPEISWSFLASMVSRNGGYNMCDLEGEWFPKFIPKRVRNNLFAAYERANWSIFRDAFPQLLLYKYSTKAGAPLFHLLPLFNISSFMVKEWQIFWDYGDRKRLTTALIVNEQNVIQDQLLEHPFFLKKVFRNPLFIAEDSLHMSAVLFPTLNGEVYGASATGFKSLDKRIELGKRLASILFDPGLQKDFLEFALAVEHTGSRHDYERYVYPGKRRDTPFLRTVYPIVEHHYRNHEDWLLKRNPHKKWMDHRLYKQRPLSINKWFLKKQRQIQTAASIIELAFNS